MSRIGEIFERAGRENRPVLITYLVGGDGGMSETPADMHALARGGAEIIEVGLPFSDPEADGPEIQAGHERALASGARLDDLLDAVRTFRQEDTSSAVVLMGYLNVLERRGAEAFASAAAEAGVDGMILVNLPPEETRELRGVFDALDLDLILLVAPTTTETRARTICAAGTGFTYYVSLKGTTGAAHLDPESVAERVAVLRTASNLPIAVGFGIRDAQSAASIGAIADGVVVGSAVVRMIGEHADDRTARHTALQAYAQSLRTALDGAR